MLQPVCNYCGPTGFLEEVLDVLVAEPNCYEAVGCAWMELLPGPCPRVGCLTQEVSLPDALSPLHQGLWGGGGQHGDVSPWGLT